MRGGVQAEDEGVLLPLYIFILVDASLHSLNQSL